MITEERLTDTLKLMVAGEPPAAGARARFESRLLAARRRRIAGTVAGVAASAACIAALALLGRGIVAGPEPAPHITNPPRPGPTPGLRIEPRAFAASPAAPAPAGSAQGGGAQAPSHPQNDPACRAEHGSLGAGVPCDALATELIAFMDARIRGTGAESYLTSDAKAQYDSREGGLSLYSPSPALGYSRYRIASREVSSRGLVTYTVLIETATSPGAGRASGGADEGKAAAPRLDQAPLREELRFGPGLNWEGSRRPGVVHDARRPVDGVAVKEPRA